MNQLFPIFLKTESLQILLVGGGKVAEEKLHFLLKSSPQARVTVVAPDIKFAVRKYAQEYDFVTLRFREYRQPDLLGHQVVIAATNNPKVNALVKRDANALNILTNTADTPDECDFYLGGVVTKNDVKVAISTNGKSPTLAKRLRQLLEDALPEEVDELANNLHAIRSQLKGDLHARTKQLNELTRSLVAE